MRIFVYKILILIVSLFFLYQFTIGYTIYSLQQKIFTKINKENSITIKSKIREELKSSLKKERILNKEDALTLMTASAEIELSTDKQSLTPGEVLPAQELLGDLLIELNEPSKALEAYNLNLSIRPNRFNSIYGAAIA